MDRGGVVPSRPVECVGARCGERADHVPRSRVVLNTLGRRRIALCLEALRLCGRHLADNRAFLDPDATYLVTGGLGGLGLRMVAFPVASGARRLTPTNRDGERRRSVEWVRRASGIDDVFPDLNPGLGGGCENGLAAGVVKRHPTSGTAPQATVKTEPRCRLDTCRSASGRRPPAAIESLSGGSRRGRGPGIRRCSGCGR